MAAEGGSRELTRNRRLGRASLPGFELEARGPHVAAGPGETPDRFVGMEAARSAAVIFVPRICRWISSSFKNGEGVGPVVQEGAGFVSTVVRNARGRGAISSAGGSRGGWLGNPASCRSRLIEIRRRRKDRGDPNRTDSLDGDAEIRVLGPDRPRRRLSGQGGNYQRSLRESRYPGKGRCKRNGAGGSKGRTAIRSAELQRNRGLDQIGHLACRADEVRISSACSSTLRALLPASVVPGCRRLERPGRYPFVPKPGRRGRRQKIGSAGGQGATKSEAGPGEFAKASHCSACGREGPLWSPGPIRRPEEALECPRSFGTQPVNQTAVRPKRRGGATVSSFFSSPVPAAPFSARPSAAGAPSGRRTFVGGCPNKAPECGQSLTGRAGSPGTSAGAGRARPRGRRRSGRSPAPAESGLARLPGRRPIGGDGAFPETKTGPRRRKQSER